MPVAVVHSFRDADPQIQQSQTGSQAAHESRSKKPAEAREIVYQTILSPGWQPWKHAQDQSDPQTKNDCANEKKPLHPNRWRRLIRYRGIQESGR